MRNAIPYYRVSTERQGLSGLGLEAQQLSVREYAARHQLNLLKEFTEIESGKKIKRPILIEALKECQNNNAILLIAKLDRLARNVAFISKLMESKVDFIAVDNPSATKFIIHILAAVAEHERDMISLRTKEALAAARRNGVVLGAHGRDVLSKRNQLAAVEFAQNMKPIIHDLKCNGITSVRDIVYALNKNQILTYTGKEARWHIKTVHDLLKRIESLN